MRFITASKAAVARRGFSQPDKMVFWATETYKQPAMTTTQETACNYAVCVCVSGTHKDALFAAQTRLSHRRGNAVRTERALSSHFSTTHTFIQCV